MRADLKYIGFGTLIGILATAFLLSGIGLAASLNLFSTATPTPSPTSTPTQTPSPTSTPTNTPTPLPTFTATPTPIVTSTAIPTPTVFVPTATPDPILQMILSGELVISGPLAPDRQIQLYKASMQYIATTYPESLALAKKLNEVGYGNPNNICGPLAITILRDAGIVSQDVSPHDFWLLNPFVPEDRDILSRAFPPASFEDIKMPHWLKNFDWRTFPLQPGDFLYLKAGEQGNFDHMLVVNRVDQNQRAYAVTNYNTVNGFIITEVLLYDPNDSTAGLFHRWTEIPHALLGTTGYGGFEIWRLRSR